MYIAKDGQQLGPFTDAQIDQQLASGAISPADLAWRDGMADWQPLGQVRPPARAASAAAAPVLAGRPADAEEIRKKNLNHEAAVKSIGTLYYIGAIFIVFAAVASFFSTDKATQGVKIGMMIIFALFAWAYVWIGGGLRKLDPKVRTVATILTALGLLAFPLGTLINAYILYLLLSAKGKLVFSPEYHAIIEATPQIKYKMSIVVWILLILLVALVATGVGVAVFAAVSHKH